MITIAKLSFALLALAPQDPNEVLARFQLAGKPAAVTRTDVAVEMAFHLRRQDRGVQACDVLVDTLLTRRAAEARHLMPSDAEVRQFWAELQKQLRAAGKRPEEIAAVRNTGEAEWLGYLAVQMAQERLVHAEFDLGPDEKVTGDKMRLWQQEARKKAKIVTDPEVLPIGTAATVDDAAIPMIDLGMLLLRTSEDVERDKFIQQVVYLQSIEALAHERGIEPTAADIDRAVAERSADAARDPRYRGISFEQLLKSQGMTLAALKQSRVFRAKLLLQQLAQAIYPDQQLRGEIEHDRQAILDLVGPRRRLSMIFVRAIDDPNDLIPLDFPAAMKKLASVRERLEKDDFDVVARIESQEPMSKAQGGDLGWHTRKSDRLPEIVLSTAFALKENEVSEPVANRDGCFLVKVTGIEPVPDDEHLLARLREQRAQELSAKILADAKIEFPGAAKEQK